MTRAFFLVAIAFAACGPSSDETTTASPAPVTTPEPSPAPEPPPPPPALEEQCAIGYATPFTPTRQHLRSSRAALALHRAEEFTEAAAAFRTLADEAPGYGSARFNLACSQARAGLLEAAKATLTELFCEDLPTNLPRALADADLEPLRADIEALGASLVGRYREASEEGVSLIAFGHTALRTDEPESELHWSQPGLWKDGRFVPAGPRLQRRRTDSYKTPMFPSFITEDRVVQVETVSSSAEADYLPPLKVVERGLFDGVVRSEQRFDESANEFYGVLIGVHDGQTYVTLDSGGNNELMERTHLLTTRAVIPTPPLTSARITFGMSRWTPIDTPSDLTLAENGGSLRQGSRSIELPPDRWRRYMERLIEGSGVALMYRSNEADCETGGPGSYAVEVVDLATGTVLWEESEEGQRIFQLQEGRLWMQTNDGLFVFDDPRQTDRTPLPAGLGLSSCFLEFNPMC